MILGTSVCLVMLTACGNRGGDKVDSKGADANAAATNERTANVANSPVHSATPTATNEAVQPGPTAMRNKDNARVSSVPKPQIGTGGSDFFLYTQARAALGADSELTPANIVIDVKAGVLTLNGTVASATQVLKAEQLVRAVGGVKEVKNRLRASN